MKTKITSIQSLLPSNFQPQSMNRFVVEFDILPSFLVSALKMPTLLIDEKGNFVPKKPAKLYFYLTEEPQVEHFLHRIADKQRTMIHTNLIIKHLDAIGDIVSKYEFENVKVKEVKLQSFDYSQTGVKKSVIKFTFDNVNMVA